MQIHSEFEQILIMFLDQQWTEMISHEVRYSSALGITVRTHRDVIQSSLDPYCPDLPHSPIIRCVNLSGKIGIEKIVEIIGAIDWEHAAGAYITTRKLSDATQLAGILSSRFQGIELFGRDQDYFQFLVPLHSKHRKQLERYVIALRAPGRSIKEKMKAILKGALITLGYSAKLYENFVVTIPGPRNT